MKELYNNTLAVVAWVLILYHLILIRIYGIVQIQEGNQLILWIELAVVSAIFMLALERCIKDYKNMRLQT